MKVDGRFFRDDTGRVVFLRGVNLSGNSKLPYEPYIPTHHGHDFFEDTQISFIGRPFPISEASQHFQRLQLWGFNFLRFCVTWEALEHEGPGIHDMDYMDYVCGVLKIAKSFGFTCFIDPHQDVWSRSCGGSGAPGWTVRLAGLEPEHFDETKAAVVQNTFRGEQFPRMIWPTNYFKLATATMFTLFFAGNWFAPKLRRSRRHNSHLSGAGGGGVMADETNGDQNEGQEESYENIQDILQDCYIGSFCALAQRLKAAGLLDEVVIGYDTLNEPSPGWIGVQDLNELLKEQQLRHGFTPTPIQCMRLGQGMACSDVAYYEMRTFGPTLVETRLVDPKGVRSWNNDTPTCLWADHGVWDASTGKLLKPDYFYRHPETQNPIDFQVDCWKPFVRKFTRAIRSIHANAIMFVEPPVLAIPPQWNEPPDDPDRIVYAPHFYDGLTLVYKKFNHFNINLIGLKRKQLSYLTAIAIGLRAVRNCLANQLGIIKSEGLQNMGEVPCLIGEIGIPFDMNHGKAYVTGDYTEQIKAMDANLSGLERNMLSYTLWNYCADNSHERGDQWNGEDLSIFSIDDAERARPRSDNDLQPGVQHSSPDNPRKLQPKSSFLHEPFDPYLGGRALPAVIRPFPKATCGIPLSWSYDYGKQVLTYRFENTSHLPTPDVATEIYLPPYVFPDEKSFQVKVSDGTYTYLKEKYLLVYTHSDLTLAVHEVRVEPIVPNSHTFCEITPTPSFRPSCIIL